MIDAEVYLHQLLTRDYAALNPQPSPVPFVGPGLDVGELDHLPSVIWHVTGSGQTANGDGLWLYTLSVNVFGNGMDDAKAATKAFYDVVHAWDANPAGTVLDVDGSPVWVSSLEDNDLPSRFPSADIPGRNVVQYGGSFSLALRG